MTIELSVQDVRAELARAAGGRGAGPGEPSTMLLGRAFHEAFADLISDDPRRSLVRRIWEANEGDAPAPERLLEHAYVVAVGPRLARYHRLLHGGTEQVLVFWRAAQSMVRWLEGIVRALRAGPLGAAIGWQGAAKALRAEVGLSCELYEPGWTDAVRLNGIADCLVRVPESHKMCAVELKLGRCQPAVDMGQAALYRLLVQRMSPAQAAVDLALVRFSPELTEMLIERDEAADAEAKLVRLIGTLAGVVRGTPKPAAVGKRTASAGGGAPDAVARAGAARADGTPSPPSSVSAASARRATAAASATAGGGASSADARRAASLSPQPPAVASPPTTPRPSPPTGHGTGDGTPRPPSAAAGAMTEGTPRPPSVGRAAASTGTPRPPSVAGAAVDVTPRPPPVSSELPARASPSTPEGVGEGAARGGGGAAPGREAPAGGAGPAAGSYGELGERLQRAFREHVSDVQVVGAPVVGPRFVRYELRLGRGVKIDKVKSASTEVGLRLNLTRTPIVTHAAGRLTVDVERADPAVLPFAAVRADVEALRGPFGSSRLVVGVDLGGALHTADLADPSSAHALVAGTTGSGKTEWLRTAVAGLLLGNTPETLRLVLIDPKRVAFSELRKSPYLWTPASLWDNGGGADVVELLEALVGEMERRYGLLAAAGVDHLQEYVRASGRALPRLVCLCDEYFALLAQGDAGQDKAVVKAVALLGAKGRAAGVHLVLATQQPSRKVVSGPVDANIPCRVGLMMASSIDSKMIIQAPGAERLTGRGDLLYRSIGDPVRLQSPYVSAEERKAIYGAGA
jgi:hypothetical protein